MYGKMPDHRVLWLQPAMAELMSQLNLAAQAARQQRAAQHVEDAVMVRPPHNVWHTGCLVQQCSALPSAHLLQLKALRRGSTEADVLGCARPLLPQPTPHCQPSLQGSILGSAHQRDVGPVTVCWVQCLRHLHCTACAWPWQASFPSDTIQLKRPT